MLSPQQDADSRGPPHHYDAATIRIDRSLLRQCLDEDKKLSHRKLFRSRKPETSASCNPRLMPAMTGDN
jgi:hypothetical protein